MSAELFPERTRAGICTLCVWNRELAEITIDIQLRKTDEPSEILASIKRLSSYLKKFRAIFRVQPLCLDTENQMSSLSLMDLFFSLEQMMTTRLSKLASRFTEGAFDPEQLRDDQEVFTEILECLLIIAENFKEWQYASVHCPLIEFGIYYSRTPDYHLNLLWLLSRIYEKKNDTLDYRYKDLKLSFQRILPEVLLLEFYFFFVYILTNSSNDENGIKVQKLIKQLSDIDDVKAATVSVLMQMSYVLSEQKINELIEFQAKHNRFTYYHDIANELEGAQNLYNKSTDVQLIKMRILGVIFAYQMVCKYRENCASFIYGAFLLEETIEKTKKKKAKIQTLLNKNWSRKLPHGNLFLHNFSFEQYLTPLDPKKLNGDHNVALLQYYGLKFVLEIAEAYILNSNLFSDKRRPLRLKVAGEILSGFYSTKPNLNQSICELVTNGAIIAIEAGFTEPYHRILWTVYTQYFQISRIVLGASSTEGLENLRALLAEIDKNKAFVKHIERFVLNSLKGNREDKLTLLVADQLPDLIPYIATEELACLTEEFYGWTLEVFKQLIETGALVIPSNLSFFFLPRLYKLILNDNTSPFALKALEVLKPSTLLNFIEKDICTLTGEDKSVIWCLVLDFAMFLAVKNYSETNEIVEYIKTEEFVKKFKQNSKISMKDLPLFSIIRNFFVLAESNKSLQQAINKNGLGEFLINDLLFTIEAYFNSHDGVFRSTKKLQEFLTGQTIYKVLLSGYVEKGEWDTVEMFVKSIHKQLTNQVKATFSELIDAADQNGLHCQFYSKLCLGTHFEEVLLTILTEILDPKASAAKNAESHTEIEMEMNNDEDPKQKTLKVNDHTLDCLAEIIIDQVVLLYDYPLYRNGKPLYSIIIDIIKLLPKAFQVRALLQINENIRNFYGKLESHEIEITTDAMKGDQEAGKTVPLSHIIAEMESLRWKGREYMKKFLQINLICDVTNQFGGLIFDNEKEFLEVLPSHLEKNIEISMNLVAKFLVNHVGKRAQTEDFTQSFEALGPLSNMLILMHPETASMLTDEYIKQFTEFDKLIWTKLTDQIEINEDFKQNLIRWISLFSLSMHSLFALSVQLTEEGLNSLDQEEEYEMVREVYFKKFVKKKYFPKIVATMQAVIKLFAIYLNGGKEDEYLNSLFALTWDFNHQFLLFLGETEIFTVKLHEKFLKCTVSEFLDKGVYREEFLILIDNCIAMIESISQTPLWLPRRIKHRQLHQYSIKFMENAINIVKQLLGFLFSNQGLLGKVTQSDVIKVLEEKLQYIFDHGALEFLTNIKQLPLNSFLTISGTLIDVVGKLDPNLVLRALKREIEQFSDTFEEILAAPPKEILPIWKRTVEKKMLIPFGKVDFASLISGTMSHTKTIRRLFSHLNLKVGANNDKELIQAKHNLIRKFWENFLELWNKIFDFIALSDDHRKFAKEMSQLHAYQDAHFSLSHEPFHLLEEASEQLFALPLADIQDSVLMDNLLNYGLKLFYKNEASLRAIFNEPESREDKGLKVFVELAFLSEKLLQKALSNDLNIYLNKILRDETDFSSNTEQESFSGLLYYWMVCAFRPTVTAEFEIRHHLAALSLSKLSLDAVLENFSVNWLATIDNATFGKILSSEFEFDMSNSSVKDQIRFNDLKDIFLKMRDPAVFGAIAINETKFDAQALIKKEFKGTFDRLLQIFSVRLTELTSSKASEELNENFNDRVEAFIEQMMVLFGKFIRRYPLLSLAFADYPVEPGTNKLHSDSTEKRPALEYIIEEVIPLLEEKAVESFIASFVSKRMGLYVIREQDGTLITNTWYFRKRITKALINCIVQQIKADAFPSIITKYFKTLFCLFDDISLHSSPIGAAEFENLLKKAVELILSYARSLSFGQEAKLMHLLNLIKGILPHMQTFTFYRLASSAFKLPYSWIARIYSSSLEVNLKRCVFSSDREVQEPQLQESKDNGTQTMTVVESSQPNFQQKIDSLGYTEIFMRHFVEEYLFLKQDAQTQNHGDFGPVFANYPENSVLLQNLMQHVPSFSISPLTAFEKMFENKGLKIIEDDCSLLDELKASLGEDKQDEFEKTGDIQLFDEIFSDKEKLLNFKFIIQDVDKKFKLFQEKHYIEAFYSTVEKRSNHFSNLIKAPNPHFISFHDSLTFLERLALYTIIDAELIKQLPFQQRLNARLFNSKFSRYIEKLFNLSSLELSNINAPDLKSFEKLEKMLHSQTELFISQIRFKFSRVIEFQSADNALEASFSHLFPTAANVHKLKAERILDLEVSYQKNAETNFKSILSKQNIDKAIPAAVSQLHQYGLEILEICLNPLIVQQLPETLPLWSIYQNFLMELAINPAAEIRLLDLIYVFLTLEDSNPEHINALRSFYQIDKEQDVQLNDCKAFFVRFLKKFIRATNSQFLIKSDFALHAKRVDKLYGESKLKNALEPYSKRPLFVEGVYLREIILVLTSTETLAKMSDIANLISCALQKLATIKPEVPSKDRSLVTKALDACFYHPSEESESLNTLFGQHWPEFLKKPEVALFYFKWVTGKLNSEIRTMGELLKLYSDMHHLLKYSEDDTISKDFDEVISKLEVLDTKMVRINDCVKVCTEALKAIHQQLEKEEKSYDLSFQEFTYQVEKFFESELPSDLFFKIIDSLDRLTNSIKEKKLSTDRFEVFKSGIYYIVWFYKLYETTNILKEEIRLIQASIASGSQQKFVRRVGKVKTRVDEETKGGHELEKTMSQTRLELRMSIDETLIRFSRNNKSLVYFIIQSSSKEKTAKDVVELAQQAPWMFSFEDKRNSLKELLKTSYHSQNQKLFKIERSRILEDTLAHFRTLSPKHLNSKLNIRIEFKGEPGVDAGGLAREWVNNILLKLLDPSYGLVQLTANQLSIQPSPLATLVPQFQELMVLVGRVIGYAITKELPLDVHFSKPFLKQVLGLRLAATDLNEVDPTLYNSLQWVLENPVTEDLQQEFSYELDALGSYFTIDLFDSQHQIKVTDENKKLFVKSLSYAKLFKEIEEPLISFKKGLNEFLPEDFLQMFTAPEMDIFIGGEGKIDPKEMMKYAKYEGFASAYEDFVFWFWEIVMEMDQETLSALLFFITGNSKVAIGGFKEHPITVAKGDVNKDSLPISQTCFARISLPIYPAKEYLRDKLYKAVLEGKGFYMA